MQHICMHPIALREAAMKMVHDGLNDCEISRRTGIARTTIRDWRRPRYAPRDRHGLKAICPRCWNRSPPMRFSAVDYSELLGLYLGDGYIVRLARTWRLRLYLDSRHPEILRDSKALLERCFSHNKVGRATGHEGRMTILSVYSSHAGCLFPQHGPGMKHQRDIALESWQQQLVDEAPWAFLRGCIRSDGCSYINRTGPYEYLSYEFSNRSQDILDLFGRTCTSVGVEFRRYDRAIRIYRRSSVALMETKVGVKR